MKIGFVTVNRKFILKQLRDLFFFLLASIVQTWLTCPRCHSARSFLIVTFFTFAIWVLLWKGNALLNEIISRKISWLVFPTRRLFVAAISTILYTCIATLGSMKLFELIFQFNFGSRYMLTVYIAIGVTIFISLVLHGREFFLHWRSAAIEKDRYEQESIKAKYESLKNQVNPHFLFNSLNALTNLVYEDRDKAVRFIKQLSDVYRYVLDTREKEIVSLEEELKFLNSYLYLQKIRFGEKLNVTVALTQKDGGIAPLALQMLIENAVKHNIVSEEDPLTIRVFEEEPYIVVSNNLQRKHSMGEPSAGVGLHNICRRYEFLSPRKVIISETNGAFTVKLPRIEKLSVS